MPHLLVDISAHGLGHLAQTAPVLGQLRRHLPDLRLTVRSALSRQRLVRRIAEPFAHIDAASDFGFVMHNAVDIDFATSAARYQAFHAGWAQQVNAEAEALRHSGATAILANAAYLPLAGAAQAGIPAIGMCSLNWADLFQHYFGHEDWAVPIHRQILGAYNAATAFLCVTPGMPMAGFHNRRRIGPIASLATTPRPVLRRQLAAELGLDEGCRWVLVAMGGMEFRLPIEQWPPLAGVQFLCPQAWNPGRADIRAFDPPGRELSFTDILAASDAVLTKPGYGTFVEAACNGTPVLYLPRDDWPEEAPLAHWLHANGRGMAIDRAALFNGDVAEALAALWQQAERPRPVPTGAQESAELLLQRLSGGTSG
jgi:hypothetical protein